MKKTTLTRSMAVAMTAAMVVGLTACGSAKEEKTGLRLRFEDLF